MKENSERVPKKNFRELSGKPLFFHIGDSLNQAECFDKLIINTDSHKIAKMAINRYGDWVQINERPKDLCGDFISMNRIIEYDIKNFGNEFHFFQTHSTNPLLKSASINNAISQYRSDIKDYDSLFSVTPIRTRFYDKDINPINHNPEELIRTQDLEPYYEENSNFYVFSKSSFENSNNERIGTNPNFYKMDKIESIDIDDESDFMIAQSLLGEISK